MATAKTCGRVRTKILCFGASMTEGYTSDGNGYFPYGFALQDMLGTEEYEVTVSGNSGETTGDLLKRLSSVLSFGPFDVVIVLGGTNDVGMELPLNESERHLRGITKLIQHHKATAVLLSIPPCGRSLFMAEGPFLVPRQKDLNARIKQICIDESAVFVDLFTHVADAACRLPDDLSDEDGLHLSRRGYVKLAKAVHDTLVKLQV